MPFSVSLLNFLRGMNLDNDYERIEGGDYARALDIRTITSDGQSSHAVEDIKGNKHIFTLPTVVQQNKIIRVYLSVAVSTTIVLEVRDSNGLVATTFAFTSTDINTGLAALSTSVSTALGLTGNTTTITSTVVDTTSGYIDVEITTILGKEWVITGQYGTLNDVQTVTLQEAIDASIANELIPIGGEDLLGDLFIYSTSQDNLPIQIDITFVGQSGALFLITTATPHGAQTGFEITIQGAESSPSILSNANGVWIINVLSPTTFELIGSVWDANGIGGKVTVNGHGLGEIGVSQFDFATNTATYTTLIRSKKFNFNTLKQIDCTHKKTNVQFDLKWTDDYNAPRVLYYKGAFVTNGAITVLNPDGFYSYDTLEEETRLFVGAPRIQLNFKQQYQSGGAIQSGNWRYAVRLLTESLTTSEPTRLTNPVNVYTADFNGDPEIITGNAPQLITPKINELIITGIPIGVFKFVELIGVNYVGQSMVGYVIRRDVVGNSDTQSIQHTGLETLQDFDLGQLNVKSAAYDRFKNIDRIENRVVFSNGETPLDRDMTAWAHQIKYRLKTTEISSTGWVDDPRAAEYFDCLNVNNRVGYMDNETYRIGIELRYRTSGVWSSAYHAFDVTFNRDNATTDGRRLQGLAAWNLTTGDATFPKPLVRYIEGTNLDWDFVLSDGSRVRDVFSAARFVRAECVPEVLATGMTHLGIELTSGFPQDIVPFPHYYAFPAAYPNINIETTFTGVQSFTLPARQRFGFFYSPDVLFGNATVSFLNGMKLNVLGQMDAQAGNTTYSPTSPPALISKSNFVPMNGYLGIFNNIIDYNQFDIDGLANLSRAGSTLMAGSTVRAAGSVDNVNGQWYWQDQKCIALHTTADINQQLSVPIRGVYYTQLFRALTDKYGDVRNTKYVGTGNYIEVTDSSSAADTTDIFGGDTFVQKTYLHQRYWDERSSLSANGYGGGYSFYSQNRMNSQMRAAATGVFPISDNTTAYPGNVGNWLYGDLNEGFEYDFGYNIRNNIQIDPAFDPLQVQQTDLPTIFIYSEPHPENSNVDMERYFLPFNFKYADNIYGEVMHHQNVNGQLLAWQREAFSDMYFNSRALLTDSQDGSEVITGTGAIMKQPQNVLSTHGTDNKYSVGTWLSAGGKDIVGWMSSLKAICRFGFDGTVVISDRNNIASFLANNLTDVPDIPAHGQGINFVSHQRYGDCIWTVKNPDFNQNYSICWNERENKFKAFYTAKPNISFPWFNFYISSNPDSKAELFQADVGNYLEFFGVQNDGYIEMVFHTARGGKYSIDENTIKRYLSMYVNSEIRPYKIEWETKNFKTVTYPLDADVEQNINDWYLPIKNDILTSSNGVNNFEDTSELFGNYILIRFYFQGGTYQRLRSAVLKFSVDARTPAT